MNAQANIQIIKGIDGTPAFVVMLPQNGLRSPTKNNLVYQTKWSIWFLTTIGRQYALGANTLY